MESIKVLHLLNEHRAEIEKQLGYLVNVAKRLKLAAPTWEFSEVYEHEFAIEFGFDDGEGHQVDEEIYIEKCFDVTLHIADTLKIDGNWIFSCVIDHRAKAMTQIDETVEIPMRYSPSNDCCEHCGKKYPRVKSYIVHNQNNNEFKQVGKGCLKQFLGINPASYITMFEAVSKFSPVVKGFGRKNTGGRLDNLAYSVSEMLNYTVHQVSKDKGVFVKPEWTQIQDGYGYRGEERYKNVRTNEGQATLDKVKIRLDAISFFRMNPNLRNDTTTIEELQERIRVYSKRLELYNGIDMKTESRAKIRSGEIRFSISEAKRHIHAITYKNLLDENVLNYPNKLEAIKEFTEGLEVNRTESGTASGFDDYKLLLKNIFSKERTLQANLKTIVSGYGFYLTQMERAKQDAIRKANAEHLVHVGIVGKESELILKIVSYKEGVTETPHGTRIWKLWGMEDEAGNKFSKFGEINKKYTIIEGEPTSEISDVSIGSTISITAMVKEHKVYRDEKSTVLGIIKQVEEAPYLYITKKIKKNKMNIYTDKQIIDIALKEESIIKFKHSIQIIEQVLTTINGKPIKVYSLLEVEKLIKELKKVFPDCKIKKEKQTITIGYSQSTGYSDWYNVDEYSFFGAEQLLIWNKHNEKK